MIRKIYGASKKNKKIKNKSKKALKENLKVLHISRGREVS
jgi:hypothetical protein